MEDSLIGAIAAGVVCGVMFLIAIGIVCYLIYRCRRHEDEKSSQRETLINGHVPNGVIPSVTQLVPHPTSQARTLYQFPTMPVRHMASYRPRYIEERNPAGMPNGHTMVVKSQTYSGPYSVAPKAPVFYDVRQHGDFRSNRPPVWTQKTLEESEAIMTLGEESPKMSERHFEVENNNNRTSVKSNKDHSNRSSRTEDIRIPSPDASRMGYLFTTELEPESPRQPSLSQSANENKRDLHTSSKEPANDVQREMIRESTKRQRRGEEGALPGDELPPVSRHRSSHHRDDPTPESFGKAVYIFGQSSHPIIEVEEQQTLQQSFQQPHQQPIEEPIQRYFINDDVYTVSTKVNTDVPIEHGQTHALHVVGRPVGAPEVNHVYPRSHDMMYEQPNSGGQLPGIEPLQASNGKELHHIDYRVIKSTRRPSWLQNAGQWFSRGKKNK